MRELTESQRAAIVRRAQIDATAHKSGWPVACPYADVKSATSWRKAFDASLLEAKKK